MAWHNSQEMNHFKQTTIGSIVVMGRGTYESIDREPLPHRMNIVLSKSLYDPRFVVKSKWSGITAKQYFIIGGASIYAQALEKDIPDRLLLSFMHEEYPGDTFFPAFDESKYSKKLVKVGGNFDVYEYLRLREEAK